MLKSEALDGTAGFELDAGGLVSEDDTVGGRRPVAVVPEDMAGFVVPDVARDARLAVPAAIGFLASTGLDGPFLRSSVEAIDGLDR